MLERLDRVRRGPPRSEPNEEAVRKRLNKQRDHLFTFLDHDGVDATNNLAERQLRPAGGGAKADGTDRLSPNLMACNEVLCPFGHQDFILCLGYKADVIKNYFRNYDECVSNDFVLSGGGKKLELLTSDIRPQLAEADSRIREEDLIPGEAGVRA